MAPAGGGRGGRDLPGPGHTLAAPERNRKEDPRQRQLLRKGWAGAWEGGRRASRMALGPFPVARNRDEELGKSDQGDSVCRGAVELGRSGGRAAKDAPEDRSGGGDRAEASGGERGLLGERAELRRCGAGNHSERAGAVAAGRESAVSDRWDWGARDRLAGRGAGGALGGGSIPESRRR